MGQLKPQTIFFRYSSAHDPPQHSVTTVPQWTLDAMITSFLRQNDVVTLFLRNNDVIVLLVRWISSHIKHRRLLYFYLLGYIMGSFWIPVIYFPIFVRVAALELVQIVRFFQW